MGVGRWVSSALLIAGALGVDASWTSAHAQAAPLPTTITGTFYILWRDAAPGTVVTDDRRYAIVDDHGGWSEVRFDAASLPSLGALRSLDRQRVTIDALDVQSAAAAHAPTRVIHARAARLATKAIAPSVRGAVLGQPTLVVAGSMPYVTILCRFQDTPAASLPAKSLVQTIMGSAYPGMDNYYREVSNGMINLTGSTVVGWYTLPHPRSYYVVNDQADMGKLVDDCTGAADPDVNFPTFRGINLQFSDRLDCCSFGGGWTLDRDGTSRGYGVTWLASWALNSANYGHEMGHTFGFPHSHGPYGQVYDSKWDIMSYGTDYFDPSYGWIGPQTIAFHKELDGWIPAARRFVAPTGTSTVLIERSAQPGTNANYLVADIAIPGTNEHYTVEARQFAGKYDAHVPGEAIILHRCGSDATVVDPDNNGNPNDAGAMWEPGETFTDAANKISVSVDARVGTAWQVTIRNQVATPATPPTMVALAAGALLGTATLSPAEQHDLDVQGNDDGTYDLGDFLALVARTGTPASGALVRRVLAHAAASPAIRDEETHR